MLTTITAATMTPTTVHVNGEQTQDTSPAL